MGVGRVGGGIKPPKPPVFIRHKPLSIVDAQYILQKYEFVFGENYFTNSLLKIAVDRMEKYCGVCTSQNYRI